MLDVTDQVEAQLVDFLVLSVLPFLDAKDALFEFFWELVPYEESLHVKVVDCQAGDVDVVGLRLVRLVGEVYSLE